MCHSERNEAHLKAKVKLKKSWLDLTTLELPVVDLAMLVLGRALKAGTEEGSR